MRMDAVLPAGGRIEGDFAVKAGSEIKALISFGGRTLLERTIETLRATGQIDRIVVIGPDELKSHAVAAGADAVLPEDSSGPANIFRGIEWLNNNGDRTPRRLMILTTDLPFITPEAVTGFIDACPHSLDICVPVLRRQEFESRFPGSPTVYVRLVDGEWTLGCAFCVNPAALLERRQHIEDVFTVRKSQIRMLRLLGPLFVLRFLTKRLTIPRITARCLDILGCSGSEITGAAPELGFDIDLPEEYDYAFRHGNWS